VMIKGILLTLMVESSSPVVQRTISIISC